MKKIIFILRGLWFFKICKKNNAIALVVNEFNDKPLYNNVLKKYKLHVANKEKVYILCAFSNANLATNLNDYRDLFIFENDADKMMSFCAKKGIAELYYYDNDVLFAFFKKMGLKTIKENSF